MGAGHLLNVTTVIGHKYLSYLYILRISADNTQKNTDIPCKYYSNMIKGNIKLLNKWVFLASSEEYSAYKNPSTRSGRESNSSNKSKATTIPSRSRVYSPRPNYPTCPSSATPLPSPTVSTPLEVLSKQPVTTVDPRQWVTGISLHTTSSKLLGRSSKDTALWVRGWVWSRHPKD